MKKIISLLIAVIVLMTFTSCESRDKPELMRNSVKYTRFYNSSSDEKYVPLNYDVMKGMWVTYFELAKIISGKTEQQFRTGFEKICEDAESIGVNTLFVHVRAFSDSFYYSGIYPMSLVFTGERFDALKDMAEIAHRHKLSLHAWINPLRCETKENVSVYEGTAINDWINKPAEYDEYICYLEKDGHYWLDPAASEVRAFIAEGTAEIVRNYDVDGIHIDDYFYPTDEPFFDAGRYVESGTSMPLDEWRRENCSLMVSEIYQAVKREDKAVLFGISPQGNIGNNYTYVNADVKRWSTEKGFADYILPQIYYGYKNDVKPFSEALEDWVELCRDKHIKLVIGTAAYKLETEAEYIEDRGIIGRQIADALDTCDGAAVYSYGSLFGEHSGRVSEEVEYIRSAFCKNS